MTAPPTATPVSPSARPATTGCSPSTATGQSAASNVAHATTTATDDAGPAFLSAAVPAAGTQVDLTMSEDLDLDSADRPLKGAFAVTADGSPVPVAAVEVRSGVDDGLALALGQKIFVGQAVRVSYTDPTAGNDTRALQDTDGNDAASFDRAVTNNSVQFSGPPAQVTGLMLTTPRSGQIRAMWERPARASGYRVEWKSGSQGYTGARSTTLSRASATSTTITGLAVGVTYTVRVIATNAIGDGPPSAEARATTRRSIRLPEPESVEVESGGDEIIVTFATEFARRPLPFLEDFTLLADGVAVPLSSVATCRARSLVNQPCDTTYNPHRPNPSDKVRLRTDWYRLVKGERAVERYRIRTGAPVTLSYADFENVAAANNSTHAPTKPYHPRNVEAVARGAHRIDVSWSAPAFNGGRAITTYRVEASPDGSTDWDHGRGERVRGRHLVPAHGARRGHHVPLSHPGHQLVGRRGPFVPRQGGRERDDGGRQHAAGADGRERRARGPHQRVLRRAAVAARERTAAGGVVHGEGGGADGAGHAGTPPPVHLLAGSVAVSRRDD